MLKFYDTLTKKKRIFKPIKDNKVSMYSCGPTVYNYVHIGNLRAYIFVDLLKRYLKYSGYKVKHVMNLTDVDDKTIRDSQKSGKTLKKFTDFYAAAFLEDLEALNIMKPDVMPRATEYINEMVDIVKKLEKQGYAYKADGSTYFKISEFKKYGELAGLEKQSLKENASGRLSVVDEYEKKDANDFVLWKEWQYSDGDVFWDTKIGKGRPGWHIECSAMAMKNLGKTFDIHCGGEDLIFPHHTNEIAQSEGATGEKFVNYWLHNSHLLVDGQKMSKSLGNFHTLRDIADKGYDPLLLRIVLIKTHYRHVMDFSFDSFVEAKSIGDKFINFLINLDFIKNKGKNNLKIDKMMEKCRKNFEKGMDDDLNVSLAFSALSDFVSDVNKVIDDVDVKQAEKIRDFIFELDEVFGFIGGLYEKYLKKISEKTDLMKIKQMLVEREEARKSGDYQRADEIRREIMSCGLAVEDRKGGYIFKLVE